MTAYLISAIAVIFISIIVSIIVPEGKLNKFVTFILKMICVLVMLQPLANLFKIKNSAITEPEYDIEYICNVYADTQNNQLEKWVEQEFGEQCECRVEVIYVAGEFKANSVSIVLENENIEKAQKIYEYLEKSGYINISVYAKSD